MTTWGITPAGFALKPYSAILLDYQNAWLANVDPQADLSATTPEGQILAIVANNDSQLWELGQAGYNSFNREDVEGAGLDNLGDLTGDPREGSSFTQVLCTLGIDVAHAPYAPGSLVAAIAGVPGETFSNVNAVTSAMITASVAIGILFQATTTGQTPTVNPGTLTSITSPVTGWSSITNPSFQTQLGSNEEQDNAYAVRQVEELGDEGACNASATAAALIALGASQQPPITISVEILENDNDSPITIGTLTLPPHTFAPIVYDPTATLTGAQIAGVIYANKPQGIASYGTTLVTVLDPVLGPQNVFYTPPTARPLFVTAVVVLQPGYTLLGITADIQAALFAASIAPTIPGGAAPPGQLVPGSPVIGSQLATVIGNVPGVFDLQSVKFDFVALPSNTAPLAVPATNIATISPANVSVVTGTYP